MQASSFTVNLLSRSSGYREQHMTRERIFLLLDTDAWVALTRKRKVGLILRIHTTASYSKVYYSHMGGSVGIGLGATRTVGVFALSSRLRSCAIGLQECSHSPRRSCQTISVIGVLSVCRSVRTVLACLFIPIFRVLNHLSHPKPHQPPSLLPYTLFQLTNPWSL